MKKNSREISLFDTEEEKELKANLNLTKLEMKIISKIQVGNMCTIQLDWAQYTGKVKSIKDKTVYIIDAHKIVIPIPINEIRNIN